MTKLLAAFILLLGLTMTALPAPAGAQTADEAGALLTSQRFEDVERGITALAASGNERAGAILEAVSAGRAVGRGSDNVLLLRADDGSYSEALTGAKAEVAAGGTKPIRLNNRVRRTLAATIGAMSLMAPQPDRRLAAANAVFTARDPEALPAVEAALAKETNAGVKAALEQAKAAILLSTPDAPVPARVEAVKTIASRGDQEALSLLRALPADVAPEIRSSADRSIASIAQRQALLGYGQNVLYGISLGSVLLLAAIGLAVTFGVMGVINMAHGEMVMLGAYATFMVQEVCRTSFPWLLPWSPLIALPCAFILSGAVGIAIERGVIRFLYGRPLETLLATWGLSLMLQQAVRSIFGPTNREVSLPFWMSGSLEIVPGLGMATSRIVIIAFCLAVFLGLLLVIAKSRFGLEMRAVTQNRRMAAGTGINTGRVDMMTFGLGSGIAGLAGVALSQIDNVSPNLGTGYIVDSFMVVVFGGVGQLWGTLVGALTLGIVNKLLEPVAGAVLGKVIVLVLIILFIQRRPQGLFVLRGRSAEA